MTGTATDRAYIEAIRRGQGLALEIIRLAAAGDPVGMLDAAGDFLNNLDAVEEADLPTFDEARRRMEALAARVVHATVTHTNDDHEMIEVGGHNIQCGGRDGDGYCYTHQTFACLDNLTEEERAAMDAAR